MSNVLLMDLAEGTVMFDFNENRRCMQGPRAAKQAAGGGYAVEPQLSKASFLWSQSQLRWIAKKFGLQSGDWGPVCGDPVLGAARRDGGFR